MTDPKDVLNHNTNSSEAIKYRPSTSEENGDAILFKDKISDPLRASMICKTWWKRRSVIEKSLVLLLGGTVCLCIILILLLATKQGGKDSSNTYTGNTCISTSCVHTASSLISKMDTSVEPCQDFFQYACGKWTKDHYIPEDQSVYDIFTEMRDKVELINKRLLEAETKTTEPEFITKAKLFYNSCLDEETINKQGAVPLLEIISDVGGWPVMGNGEWNEDSWDLVTTLGKLRTNYETRSFIDMWISADDKDSDTNIIYVDQPDLGMPSRDYFLKNNTGKYVTAYLDYMVQIATKLRPDGDAAEARRQMQEVLAFETKIAEFSVPKAERRDMKTLYNKMTIRELSQLVPQFDWLLFLNMATPASVLDEYEYIVNYSPAYLIAAGRLIVSEPKRVIANYMVWDLVMKNIAYLSEDFRMIRQSFRKVIYGEKLERIRWRQCVSQTTYGLGMAVGALFIEDSFDEESKETALEMITDIRESFSTMLQNLDWMDGETKIVAQEKADAIIERIGYPDYLLNRQMMNEQYRPVTIHPSDYFGNILNIYKWQAYESLSTLRLPVDKHEWKTTPATVNAFYNPSRNEIVFPAGILQPPFYSSKFPKSMNYGGIGMVIGHEITHGFDDRGRQFDKDGNWHQWWTNSSVENFKKKAQCIVDQYSNYSVPEINMNVNGIQTQGENIADNGGIKEAFLAYRKWVERNGKEEDPLPGIDLTHNQLFFVNFGQLWCGLATNDYMVNFVSSAWHSPRLFRVFGPVSNSPEFAEAFGCRKNTPMNPEKKCSVW